MKTKHPVDEWRAVLRQELKYIERNPCKAKPISCEPAQLKRLLDDADRVEELEREGNTQRYLAGEWEKNAVIAIDKAERFVKYMTAWDVALEEEAGSDGFYREGCEFNTTGDKFCQTHGDVHCAACSLGVTDALELDSPKMPEPKYR